MGSNYLFAIGIDNYRSPQISNLYNAVNDAKEIIQILTKRYGFELLPEPLFDEQATKQNIYDSFTRLVTELQEEDNLIIYYSGHGRMHPLTSKGYWIPQAANDTPSDFLDNSVIKDFIGAIKAKHIFLIVDSCFSGTFLSTTRGYLKESKYTDLHKINSRWMLASGGEETVSDGKKGEHSPFAWKLIDVLEQNTNKYISVEEIIRYVSVLTAADAKQKPAGAHIENIGYDGGGQLVLTLSEDFTKTNIDVTKGLPNTDVLLKNYREVYKVKSNFAAGKDVLIIKSFVDEMDFLIVELFRFDDFGKKKIVFRDDCAAFNTTKGEEIKWFVIQRFATVDGLQKFLDENKQIFESKKIAAIGASSEIDTVEDDEKVIEHKEFLQDLYDMNVAPTKCLHCSNMITTNDSYTVEIDEDGLKNNVGNVHKGCLRPLDRIMGRSFCKDIKESNLINFNYDTWLSLIEKGQGIITRTKYSTPNNIPILAWNRKHNFNAGEYCLKAVLEDGSYRYVRLGKEIHRFKASEIEKELIFFNKNIEENKGDNAFAYTSKKYLGGAVSKLREIKSEDETILRIVKYEKARYSAQLDIYKNIDNDYAPLGIVIDVNTGQIVNFGNCIPLISDPLKFDDLHADWNKVGYTIGKCTLQIIESDKDFDLHIMTWLDNNMQPIIDPIFDNEKELISGMYIRDVERLFENGKQKSASVHILENAKWKAGDRVKVVLPDVNQDEFPVGTLMTDEFIDEDGEKRIIFCPIVDGVQRQDLTVTIPSKFIKEL